MLVTLIRVYKTKGYDNLDPAARKHFQSIHHLEFTATRKLKEAKAND